MTFWYLWWFKVSSVAVGGGWSALLCQVQSQHCHLHGDFRALHASICWHTLSAKTNTKSFADHLLTLLDWPVISSDLRATENLLDWWKTPEPKIKRAEGCYQSRRCFNNISATQNKYQLYKKDYCQQLEVLYLTLIFFLFCSPFLTSFSILESCIWNCLALKKALLYLCHPPL